MTRKKTAFFLSLLVMLAVLGGVLLQKPMPILSHNAWDSYTRQALSWREGITYLDDTADALAYLELAIFQGRHYVSFPPVPSLVELPLTYIFGQNTPDHLLLFLYTLLSGVFLTLTVRRKHSTATALCFGLLASAGTNLLATTSFGGVWHEAQGLSFLLCSLAAYFITSPKRIAWYFALLCGALAVGCRPFVVFFMPALLWMLYKNLKTEQYTPADKEKARPLRLALLALPFLILPALVAGGLMWYNQIRFGSPLEFGHNYLPEFMREEHGQFSLVYAPEHLVQIFRLPTVNGEIRHFSLLGLQIPYFAFAEQPLSFNMFSANAFFLVNPIILLYMLYALRDTGRTGGWGRIWFTLGFVLMIFATCMHKSLGGFQFGARYFLDMIPFLLLYLSVSEIKAGYLEWTLCIGGILLNLWGVSLLYA